MLSRVHSFVLQGIDAEACEIEVDLSPSGMPKTTIVGLPDTAVKEAVERVRTAISNSGLPFPQARTTINLAPADVKKEGPVYDLAMAVGILAAEGAITSALKPTAPSLDDYLIAGELALDGRVRPVSGAISLALLARRQKRRGVIVPVKNAQEAASVDGVEVLGARTLGEVAGFFNADCKITPTPTLDIETVLAHARAEVDFSEVRGQEAAKRALTIAAAGAHNLIMIGPAGTGKTMMARALAGVLPPLTRDEALEVTRIYSSVGKVPENHGLITTRPVRSPHHTASAPAIVGGGSIARPGDVSLAHRGILFLDEMPEFNRAVLETLRQPLEDGCVTVARASGSVRFPARFMLVAAMNPTPKGNTPKDEYGRRAMDRYLSRISGPLIDRIDIHIEVPAVPFKHLSAPANGTSSESIRDLVCRTRAVQAKRQGIGVTNSELARKKLDLHAPMSEEARMMLGQAMNELGLSARAYDKVRRVARTIADMEGSESIEGPHIGEAVQYRLVDRAV